MVHIFAMQIENIIKDLPLPPPPPPPPVLPPPPPPAPPIPTAELLGIPTDLTPHFPSQLLQLKWQLFCVQKSQQELASAILQLSSMILVNSSPQLGQPSQQPQQPLPLGVPDNKPPWKRRWNSKERGSSSASKYAMMSINQTKSKAPWIMVPCQCDVCQKNEAESVLPKQPDPINQSSLDSYVSYFLNSLENRQLPLPPNLAPPQQAVRRTPIQQQEKPLDLATHSRSRPAKIELTGDLGRPRPSFSQPAIGETTSELITSPNSLNLSPTRDSSPLFLFHKSQSDGRINHEPAFDDILQLEAAAASTSAFKPAWTHTNTLTERDRAVVILNPTEPREMFVGGEAKVRLPVWAYKKCVYMVGREQKRPAARLCLCLLQSLFSLRYLVSHNYSGSRQKRPIDPVVMKAVLRQAMMQFSKGDNVLPGTEFSQGKLRDYLNNAFRVMAFRRRRGDRVKSPFWNDAGEPILNLEPPKDFRLNDIILTKVLPPFR
ncbi:hypothetical protein TcWFU_003374 [Taenia crassiceps]|uniref:DUF5725 domain-containing protein n=1 Tax=Taenia crassiceps TaxID=6207 RepID=A0ABR4Q427_9CEST